MSNDSSSGGYLLPASAPAPLEGLDLLRFVQQWIVGVSGLPGEQVRPRWQPEPPDIPQAGTCWAAVGFSRPRRRISINGGTNTTTFNLQRHGLVTLTSFYDTGSTGQADLFAAQFPGQRRGHSAEP